MAKSKTLISVVSFVAILFFVLSLTIMAPSTTLANPEEEGAAQAEEQVTPPAEQPNAPAEQVTPPTEQPNAPAAEQQESSEVININTAGEQDILKLKRIGPDLAKRIIDYREEKGPFKKTEDILKVKGLGQKFWKANKDRMTVGEGAAEEKKEELAAPQPSEQPESTPPAGESTPPQAEEQAAPQGEEDAPPAKAE